MRTLEIPVPDALPLAFAVRNLGQDLFAPQRQGWPGGDAWINAIQTCWRKQFIERLLRSDDFVMRPVRADRVEGSYAEAGMRDGCEPGNRVRNSAGRRPAR